MLFGSAAYAVDGVLEINQTCAVSTGCFPGDTAGYPVTITVPGSYRLTSPLSSSIGAGTVDTTRIEISADHVTLDLNGQRVSCGLVLGGDTCPGTADAIVSTGEAVEIANGVVKGFPGTGIDVGDHSIVRNVRVRHNGRFGIDAGQGALIEGCVVESNGIDGIRAALGAIVRGNSVRQNDDDGIEVSFASLVEDNVIYDNGDDGVVASGGGRVSRNITRSHTGYGLSMAPDTAFDHNTVTDLGVPNVNGGHDRGGNSCSGAGC